VIRIFKLEKLILWTKAEMIGFTTDQIYARFQVSGVRCQLILGRWRLLSGKRTAASVTRSVE
jgi:hypothetical protein